MVTFYSFEQFLVFRKTGEEKFLVPYLGTIVNLFKTRGAWKKAQLKRQVILKGEIKVLRKSISRKIKNHLANYIIFIFICIVRKSQVPIFKINNLISTFTNLFYVKLTFSVFS